MPPGHRLRSLQMGKTRHHPIGTRLGLLQKGLHQRLNAFNGRIGLIADPKTKIRRHLVIAAAARVQPARRRADYLFQALLNIHVNIFQIHPKRKIARLNF